METFSDTTPPTALNFGPRPAHEHERRERVYMLWPAFAWRVIAPEPSTRRMNLFQKAVLGLCRAGSFSSEEMGSMLHLHPRLIEALGTELAGFGWIDPKTARPTEAGLAALGEAEEAIGSQISGWVFQDPWTGDLWPHFALELRLQEVFSGKDHLCIVLGSPGRSRNEPVLQLDAPQTAAQPSTEAVLRAVRRHKRRAALRGYLTLLPAEMDGLLGDGLDPKAMQRISFVSCQPEAVNLVTFGYVPKNGVYQPQICDPFGFGASDELWHRLDKAANESQGARHAVEELLEQSRKTAGPSFQEQLALQREIAEAQVLDLLTLNIKQYPAIFDHWVALSLSHAQAIASEGYRKASVAAVLAAGRKTIEAVLKVLAQKFPIRDMHLLFSSVPTANEPILARAAEQVGFAKPLPIPLIIPGKGPPDKRSLRRAGSSLDNFYMIPSVIVATILCASRCPNHPFGAAAKADPLLLQKLCRGIELGNAGSHDDSYIPRSAPLTLESAEEMRDLLRHITLLLLGISHT